MVPHEYQLDELAPVLGLEEYRRNGENTCLTGTLLQMHVECFQRMAFPVIRVLHGLHGLDHRIRRRRSATICRSKQRVENQLSNKTIARLKTVETNSSVVAKRWKHRRATPPVPAVSFSPGCGMGSTDTNPSPMFYRRRFVMRPSPHTVGSIRLKATVPMPRISDRVNCPLTTWESRSHTIS